MKSMYNEKLMLKYGIDESDAEVINELKKKIRKASPLSKEQKGHCEVCSVESNKEGIYNHHIMKVEYLAILVYYYGLYKKEKNPNYVEKRGTSPEEINTQSEREYIYVLKKDLDLYIPRIAICERHHNMLHELAGDFEGSTFKDVIHTAKPKELKELYETLSSFDADIYNHIFEKDETLNGREYYVSYLKIWNDTMQVAMGNLIEQIDDRLQNPNEDLGKKNITLLTKLRQDAGEQEALAKDALKDLNVAFEEIGENELGIDVENIDQDVEDKSKGSKIGDELELLSINDLEDLYYAISVQNDEESDSEEQIVM